MNWIGVRGVLKKERETWLSLTSGVKLIKGFAQENYRQYSLETWPVRIGPVKLQDYASCHI